MKVLDQIGALVKAIVTTRQELSGHREALKELEQQADRMESMLYELRERVVRLEALQDANRAEMTAELSRFKSEVERAEMRLSRLLPVPKGKKST